MAQASAQPITFDQFLEWYPQTGMCYELHNGTIITMNPPPGKHELITGFMCRSVLIEASRLKLPYLIPKTAFIKPPLANSAYLPDVLLLNLGNLVNEPLWEKASTVSQGESVPLVIEVVSNNWRVDYLKKCADYEEMRIPEYWVIDYAALGGVKFIGNPKQPTVSIYQLIGDEYGVEQFRGNDKIVSPIFPGLNLTAEQIFKADVID